MKQSATLVASVSLLIGILLLVHPSPAASAAPREQLDDFFRQATTVLREASDASQARHEIRQLARHRFDVPGAARRVLEPEWSALSVVEREEFIQLFGDRLLWGYLSIVRGNCHGTGLRPFGLSVKRWARAGVSRAFAPLFEPKTVRMSGSTTS